jgi:hypothetical protein
MTRTPSGHIEQLPSGSWRAKVYAGKDPLTGREIRFRKTRKTEVEAQIELGKMLALARTGRQPDSDITVAELLGQYVPIAGWDVSTEETNLGYIRRTIRPALGAKEVRKVFDALGRRHLYDILWGGLPLMLIVLVVTIVPQAQHNRRVRRAA